MVNIKAKQNVTVSGKDSENNSFRYRCEKDEIINPKDSELNILLDTGKFEEITTSKKKGDKE